MTMHEEWCAECGEPFEEWEFEEAWVAIHQRPDGRDVHEACCVVCNQPIARHATD